MNRASIYIPLILIAARNPQPVEAMPDLSRCSEITCAISPPVHPSWLRRSSVVTYRQVRALLAPCQLGASAAIFAQVIPAQLPTDKEVARTHYQEGKAAYAAGQYQEAASKFSAGYLLDPQPAFLVNIAQSYRAAGNKLRAIHYYEEFIKAAPTSPLRAQVEELVRELKIKHQLQLTRSGPPAPRHPGVSSLRAPRPQPLSSLPPQQTAPIYKHWWFWTLVAVVVGAGVGVAAYTASRGPDYVHEGGLGTVSW